MPRTVYLDLTLPTNASYITELIKQYGNMKQFHCGVEYVCGDAIGPFKSFLH